jgi:hypothetical protein
MPKSSLIGRELQELARRGGGGEGPVMWDQMKATAIRQGLNLYLKENYGEVTGLEFDGKARSLKLQLMLHGEDAAIDVEIGHFEIEVNGEELAVTPTGVRVSRAWMQALAGARLEGKRFVIPSAFAGTAKLVFS